MLHPCIPSCFATPSLGFELFVLGAEDSDIGPRGRSVASLSEPDQGRALLRGEVAVRMPAVGCSQKLLNRDHYEEYFSGMPVVDGLPLRRHGDELEELPGLGYLKAHGRCDDTMNLGGIKVQLASFAALTQSLFLWLLTSTSFTAQCSAVHVFLAARATQRSLMLECGCRDDRALRRRNLKLHLTCRWAALRLSEHASSMLLQLRRWQQWLCHPLVEGQSSSSSSSCLPHKLRPNPRFKPVFIGTARSPFARI